MTSTSHRHPDRIAVGIDGSLWAHAAIRWAIDHARPGDTITLVHAWRAHDVAIYPGAGHAFCSEVPLLFHHDAATRGWQDALAFIVRALGVDAT